MNDRVFDFQEQLTLSEGVIGNKKTEDIILKCFPTAVKVEKANKSDDRNGTDYWVTTQSGHVHSIDVKVRNSDWCKKHPKDDDVALEVWSVVGKKVGWTRDLTKRTDYIMWIWKDTERYMLVPFPMLCDVFIKNLEDWCKKYHAPIQPNKGYNSQCVFVPRKVLWNEIYKQFGGIPGEPQRQVNTQISSEVGMSKAQKMKCYTPRVER